MTNSVLRSKRVLAICMETTAGGRNYSGGLGALYGDTTRTMHRLNASFMAVTPIYKNGYVVQTINDNGVIDEYPPQNFESRVGRDSAATRRHCPRLHPPSDESDRARWT